MKKMGNVDNVYKGLLKDVFINGTIKNDRTGTGTISIFGKMVTFDMSKGFPLLTTKKMFTKGIIHELLWFLNGDTNIKYLVDNGVNIWNGDAYKNYVNETIKSNSKPLNISEFINKIKVDEKFAKIWGELGPIYGRQWVNCDSDIINCSLSKGNKDYIKIDGINQISNAINTLLTNPESRRIIVNSWNVSDIDLMVLPPCHYSFQLNTERLTSHMREDYFAKINGYNETERYGMNPNHTDEEVHIKMDEAKIPKYKLSLMWNQRSVDTFLGLPFNIASYGILLHMICKEVNMLPNNLIGSLGDVHLYKNHLEQTTTLLERDGLELCELELNDVENIFEYKFGDIKFVNYKSHGSINAKLSN